MKKKIVILALALALVVGGMVGGVVAWLIDTTDTVTNTFTVGDIAISLTEKMNTDTNNDGTNDAWEAVMVPGKEYTKDPVVAVDGSETNIDCYLFVKFQEENNASQYLDYTSNLSVTNGWRQGDGNGIPTNVWYREVKVTDTTKSWHLLMDDKVTISETVEKGTFDNMSALPKLVYTAYAIQSEKFETAADAWAQFSNSGSST